MRVLYAMGARPNFVKMAPVVAALRSRLPDGRHIVMDTGQHYDREMSAVFMEELGIGPPDHRLLVGSGSHATQTARVMERAEAAMQSEEPDLVIVSGDVNSTVGVALAAAKLGIPLAHVEAGLRSFDRTMPEEINRMITDELSEYLFIHCQEALGNLRAEGIADERVYFVGNTMIDSLVATERRFRGLGMAERIGQRPGGYLLVTLHRPALVDTALLPQALERLGAVARQIPVVFPMHPRTQKAIAGIPIDSQLKILPPLGYLEFLSLEADAAAVLTDSGGVQEETTYLGVPCFTLRENTERPVTVHSGTNRVLGLNPERIGEIPSMLDEVVRRRPDRPPGWDGHAAERIASVLSGDSEAQGTRPAVRASR